MNIEEVRKYCLSLPDTEEAMPYGEDWVVFRVGGKIFLHMPLEYADQRISIKLPPEEGQRLRDKYEAVSAGYHLNKIHWNDILIEHTFDAEQIEKWIVESYNLVISGLPKILRLKYSDKV